MIAAWKSYILAALSTFALAVIPLSGQEEVPSPWSVSTDFLSSYIWRGSRQGSGPHIQPAIEYSKGLFTAGAWGTFDLHGYEEVDLWFAIDLPGGFTVGMQDYYLPELRYFDYSAADGSHAFEINLDYSNEHVWLSGNCVINEAGGIGTYGGDLYFETGLSFDYFSVFMGGGNGWHTESGGFNVCNLGMEVRREMKITEAFSIPVTGQLIFNPDREQMFIVVRFAF